MPFSVSGFVFLKMFLRFMCVVQYSTVWIQTTDFSFVVGCLDSVQGAAIVNDTSVHTEEHVFWSHRRAFLLRQ